MLTPKSNLLDNAIKKDNPYYFSCSKLGKLTMKLNKALSFISCCILMSLTAPSKAITIPYSEKSAHKISDRQYGELELTINNNKGHVKMKFSNGKPFSQVRLHAKVILIDSIGKEIVSCENNHHLPAPRVGGHGTERTTSCSFDISREQVNRTKNIQYIYWRSEAVDVEVGVSFNERNQRLQVY